MQIPPSYLELCRITRIPHLSLSKAGLNSGVVLFSSGLVSGILLSLKSAYTDFKAATAFNFKGFEKSRIIVFFFFQYMNSAVSPTFDHCNQAGHHLSLLLLFYLIVISLINRQFQAKKKKRKKKEKKKKKKKGKKKKKKKEIWFWRMYMH